MQEAIIFILFLGALAYIFNNFKQSFSSESKGCASKSCNACQIDFKISQMPTIKSKK